MQIKKLLSKTELIQPSQKAEILLLTAIVISSTLLLLFSTSNGLIWTSDSFQYWAASKSFASDGSFIAHDGGTYIFWTPLFPIILSFFSNYEAYYILHIIVFSASIIAIYYFFKSQNQTYTMNMLAVILFAVSVYPYLMGSFFWSENIFTLLLYASLLFYSLSRQTNKKWLYFMLAMLIASFMCLQRNAGIFILMGVSIYEFIEYLQKRILYKELIIKALLVLITIAPNILWNVRGLKLQGEQNEMITRSYFVDFFTNFLVVSDRLINIFIPTDIINHHISALAVLCFFITLSRVKRYRLPFIISTSYIILLCVMPMVSPDSIDRLLAPITPILFLMSCYIIFNNIDRKKAVIKYTIIGVGLLLFSYNIIRTSKNVMRWHERSEQHARDSKIFF